MSGANEPWSVAVSDTHWYRGALDFALESLGCGAGEPLLVIGSPLAEASALTERGWTVTFLDVREPPTGKYTYVHGDAMHMPFPNDSFSALSSTCVLCHVGLGRYDDPVESDGDRKMLAEMYRVMKKDAKAALMWGPYNQERSYTQDTTHRFYCSEDAERLAAAAGFKVLRTHIWGASGAGPYLCMVLEK